MLPNSQYFKLQLCAACVLKGDWTKCPLAKMSPRPKCPRSQKMSPIPGQSGKHFRWGTFMSGGHLCLGDIYVWGTFCQGHFCRRDILVLGTFLSGTFLRGRYWGDIVSVNRFEEYKLIENQWCIKYVLQQHMLVKSKCNIQFQVIQLPSSKGREIMSINFWLVITWCFIKVCLNLNSKIKTSKCVRSQIKLIPKVHFNIVFDSQFSDETDAIFYISFLAEKNILQHHPHFDLAASKSR